MGQTHHPFSPTQFPIRHRLHCWLALLLLGCAFPAAAQSVWTGPPKHASATSLEWLKPSFDQGDRVLVRVPVDDPLNDVFTATVGVTVTVSLAGGAEK